jgi:hypothetical protein
LPFTPRARFDYQAPTIVRHCFPGGKEARMARRFFILPVLLIFATTAAQTVDNEKLPIA